MSEENYRTGESAPRDCGLFIAFGIIAGAVEPDFVLARWNKSQQDFLAPNGVALCVRFWAPLPAKDQKIIEWLDELSAVRRKKGASP